MTGAKPALLDQQAGPLLRAAARAVFGLDVRSLALFRAGLGLLLLFDLAMRAADLRAHYTDQGVLPVELARQAPGPLVSAFFVSGSMAWATALFVLSAVSALCLTVGYRTRVATIVSWVLLVSVQNRNLALAHAGDDLLRLCLFWAMFLPLGAVASVDARRRGPPAEWKVASVGSAGLVFQLVSLFICALGFKVLGTSWSGGTAVSEALTLDQLARPLGVWLRGFPSLLEAGTRGALSVQLLIPIAALVPFGPVRTAGVLLIVMMNVTFGVCLWLGTFPWVGVVTALALLPAWFWETVARRASHPAAAPAPPATVWRRRLGLAASAFGLACIGLELACDLSEQGATWATQAATPERLDAPVWPVIRGLRLDQRWAMFAPNPQTDDEWLELNATLADGRRVDVMPDVLDQPMLLAHRPQRHRWLMLVLQMTGAPDEAALQGLGGYGCGQSRETAVRVDIERVVFAPGAVTPRERRVVWSQSCP